MSTPIGIMGAMPEEVADLAAAIEGLRLLERAGRRYACGRLFCHEVVLVHSLCGKVAAATTSTDLIAHFGVGEIIFTGVAGGVREDLRIGDVVSEGEDLHFIGIPSFAPEMLQKVRPDDPLKAKHLGRALQQLAEEGAARVIKPFLGADWIVGVVGVLQFEVMADRIRTEYDIPVRFEPTELMTARWVGGEQQMMKKFLDGNRAAVGVDHDGEPVFLARNAWHLNKATDDWPELQFMKTREQIV